MTCVVFPGLHSCWPTYWFECWTSWSYQCQSLLDCTPLSNHCYRVSDILPSRGRLGKCVCRCWCD